MSPSTYSDPGPSSPRPQSILPDDYHVPHCLDTTSEFFQVLTAPYHPPGQISPLRRAHPRSDYAAKCRTTINWTSIPPTEASSSSSHVPHLLPASQLDQPIYQPHGRWAWTHGLPIDDPKQLLSLRKGAQCSASIDSGTVASKEMKYVCRKWKTNKQTEWYGFYSELALYKSEQYLRPLQGDVVPHIIGVHILPEAVSVTMEMPHPSFWIEASPSMPDVLKEKVIAAFENIHAQGVLHGDPELRHMLISADGKVTIIDFGMSRANREHPSVGIERAEPEEFRLEMRKVKYKLDYKGARKKEGDKVDDYLRRAKRNRKISELWRRRARGERVGPIPQYEEDPEEYELDPPVNAQDFQEDWITASDDIPIRVVVPGQTSEEVANQVQALIWKIVEMCSIPSSYPQGTEPTCSSQSRHQSPHSDHQECPLPSRPSGSRSTVESRPLRRAPTARRLVPVRRLPRQFASQNSPSRKCEDDLLPLSARHIEDTSMRRDYIRYKHLKNTYISSLSTDPSSLPTFPVSIDVPEIPKSLKPEEYRKIQESRRQAMLQYSRAPKGILKRKRDEDDPVGPTGQVAALVASPCKKLRFAEQVIRSPSRGRTPFFDSLNGRRSRMTAHSRARRRFTVSTVRPELVNFTLPSFRTLSTLVGSLMPWIHCQG